MQELPAFQQVYEKFSGQIDMLAVAVDERGDPQGYFAKQGYTFTPVRDINGADACGASTIPLTLVIDANGDVVEKFNGAVSSAKLDMTIQRALGGS